ncbi:MAG: ATP-dependent RecD-like DNA helicase [Clostridiales bacterium]|nr:ATP-dependent RecD-like DNA helicase [Clostridiales bacterium]
MTSVEGTIMEIVYRNEENTYTVLEIDHEGKLLTCVGNIPLLQPGEFVRFYGAYTNHRVYGEQFKISSMETKLPESKEGIKLFLSGGLIKGVGEVLATRIVEAFGEETFQIIETDPDRLAEIKGVSRALARKIHEQVMELHGVRAVLMQLQEMGLTLKQSLSAYDAYGEAAASIILSNPYRLIDEVPGMNFIRADGIAQNIGIENYAELRVYNGVRYVLRLRMNEGHTCLPRERLLSEAAELLQTDAESAEKALLSLINNGDVSESVYNGVAAVADARAHYAEAGAAYKLMLLSHAAPKGEIDRTIVEDIIRSSNYLSEEQELALLRAVSSTVCVITGGPGTGKTTILNELISIFEQNGITTALAAPTGRAAKRMEKAAERPAKTIHRLLEYGMQSEDDDIEEDMGRFMRNEENPLEAEAIIIDESSMIDIFLLNNLLSAIEPGTRVIFTGDADQLPSVGPGNVLKDIIASKRVPVATLTEVFRQTGNIAMNAHRINKGEGVELFGAGDFVFIPTNGQQETVDLVCDEYRKALAEAESENDVQIICPVKNGVIGVHNINRVIRDHVNPRIFGKNEITFGDTVFREGDKVMQTSNNYNKEWYLYGQNRILTQGTGIFNGDIGQIDEIDTEQRIVRIIFDGEKVCEFEVNELEDIEHAYAVTVHKSQGSEFSTVILPLYYGGNIFLTRNLLYTAITRAKTRLTIIGMKRSVDFMIQNNRISRRFTALKYEIASYADFMDGLGQRSSSIKRGYDEFLGSLDELL